MPPINGCSPSIGTCSNGVCVGSDDVISAEIHGREHRDELRDSHGPVQVDRITIGYRHPANDVVAVNSAAGLI